MYDFRSKGSIFDFILSRFDECIYDVTGRGDDYAFREAMGEEGIFFRTFGDFIGRYVLGCRRFSIELRAVSSRYAYDDDIRHYGICRVRITVFLCYDDGLLCGQVFVFLSRCFSILLSFVR